MDSPDLFNAEINCLFNNVVLDRNFIADFNNNSDVVMVKEFNLSYSDAGLINEVVKTLMGVDDGDLYRGLIADQVSALSLFTTDDEVKGVFTSISGYLKNPETITINSQPESDVSVKSLLDFTTPEDYIKRLNLTIQ